MCFGRQILNTDEVVIEATGNCKAVSRVLSAHVARVAIAKPLQVKAIAHADGTGTKGQGAIRNPLPSGAESAEW